MNVLDGPEGLAELQRLGARSIPVLSRGDKFTFAQSLKPVIEFLGLNEKTGPVLSPQQLYERLDRYLSAELAMIPLMPADQLATNAPSRPRTYRTLAHHIYRVTEVFLGATKGETLEAKMFGYAPPETLTTSDLVAYGTGVRDAFRNWWKSGVGTSGSEQLPTYYGPQPMHELLERTTWHSGQHVRQWMMLLDMAGVKFTHPLGDQDFTDLPMPKNVWDG